MIAYSPQNIRKPIIIGVSWVAALVAIIPALCKWSAPASHVRGTANSILLAASAIAVCVVLYYFESPLLSRPQILVLLVVVLGATCIVNRIQNRTVDYAPPLFGKYGSNLSWQETTNDLVIQRSLSAVPHSYRFLPNSIVRWMQICGLSFEQARDLYRLIVNLLLFYTLYKYATLYTDFKGSILAMLLVVAVYPVTFLYYAGQLTDPLSYLSFLCAFIFLESSDFALLFTTIIIGSLAKETVLALSGYYVLFKQKERHFVSKAIILCTGSAAIYIAVRVIVLHGFVHYADVSGTGPHHIWNNWHDPLWRMPLTVTLLPFVPLLALEWKGVPQALKHQVLFLFPVLLVSSLMFSWLKESRNFMPVIFVLAVINARCLSEASDGMGVFERLVTGAAGTVIFVCDLMYFASWRLQWK